MRILQAISDLFRTPLNRDVRRLIAVNKATQALLVVHERHLPHGSTSCQTMLFEEAKVYQIEGSLRSKVVRNSSLNQDADQSSKIRRRIEAILDQASFWSMKNHQGFGRDGVRYEVIFWAPSRRHSFVVWNPPGSSHHSKLISQLRDYIDELRRQANQSGETGK